jgi:hemerythrin-like domain-containing protein
MTPIEILKHEHKIVLAVLEGAEREAQNIQATGKVDTDKVAKIVDFLRTFVDKCHHSKEERKLFPKLQERGMPGDTGPIAVMLHEHTLGRKEVAAISDALDKFTRGDTAAATPLAEHLLGYVKLMREHIDKENDVLFAFADNILTPADQEGLLKAFEAIESEEIGEGVHEQYHQFAHELMKH